MEDDVGGCSALDGLIRIYVEGVVGDDLVAVLKDRVHADARVHGITADPGRDGVAAALAPLVRRHQRRFVQPVRGLVDGGWALLHSYQTFGFREHERVVFDAARADRAGHIVEWWSVSSALAGISRLGMSQLDGPTPPARPGAAGAARATVAAFTLDLIEWSGGTDHRRYVSPRFQDHDPEPWIATAAGPPVRYRRLGHLIAAHDWAAAICDVTDRDRSGLACDLYRLDRDSIIEHWSTVQVPVPGMPPAGPTADAARRTAFVARSERARRNSRFPRKPPPRPAPVTELRPVRPDPRDAGHTRT